jgi:hypothetical protein
MRDISAALFPPLALSRNFTVNNCYMHEFRCSNSRKRKRKEPGALQPQLKRPKLNHLTTEFQPTLPSWDNLSKIWLTRDALRELNRRNTQPTSSQPRSLSRQSRWPVKRRSTKDEHFVGPARPAILSKSEKRK